MAYPPGNSFVSRTLTDSNAPATKKSVPMERRFTRVAAARHAAAAIVCSVRAGGAE